jgi:hypothetical protein
VAGGQPIGCAGVTDATKEIDVKKNKLTMAVMAALIGGSVTMPLSALAHDYQGDQRQDARNDYRQDRRHYYRHHAYRGRGGDYRQRCGGGNGAVGTVAGGVGGAVIGSALGGGLLGTVAGGVGGGLLGRHLDKVHTRHRNGC